MIKIYLLLILIISSACSTHKTETKNSEHLIQNVFNKAEKIQKCFIDPNSLKKLNSDDLQFLDKSYYQIVYSNKHLQPYLVTWHVKEDGTKKFKRGEDYSDKFFEDDNVRARSLNDHYKYSGWDKGHIAPNGDFSQDIKSARSTFTLSNVSPQEPSFNQHKKWKKLEEHTRKFSCGNNKELQVLAGPKLNEQLSRLHNLHNTPSIPNKFYKILIAEDKGVCRAISFLFLNSKYDGSLSFFDNVVPLNNIEEVAPILDKVENYDEDVRFWKKIDQNCLEKINASLNSRNEDNPQQLNNYVPNVKLSKGGICHEKGTAYFSRTKSFESYSSIKDCLNAGGRLPKN